MLVGECEEKKAACNVELSNLKAIANEEVIERSVAEQWADEVERFLKLETLTRETAVALIDSITALSTRDEQDNEHIALKIKYRAVGCLEAA